ncbi:YkgJ family cysteine cluster protein [Rhodoferax sp. U11-2br]|uniref:YkgJ family cysteine cluster protein n=1 Tax=Rhodoferax sp. U11-2br TaxID=2838878 RepID=UPI001BE76BCC|nr:YkgJ family cysteine cluster protein [Rhodoferax sp. U11-2br]MBT3066734.1 YkgJ family cysteine cluster protein [Rhodoferax sp. U11-2br]
MNPKIEEAKARSRSKLTEFLSAMPKDLDARDDVIAERLRRENSSAKSKLGKIYTLMTDLSHAVKPYVACGKGCSDCCKMNVSISDIEADRLSMVSRKPMAVVKQPVRHSLEDFSGVPCPFLVKDACSVYDARPYACRAHYSFDTSAYWCHPERSNAGEMSLLQMGGARQAYDDVVVGSRLRGFADIRDFFPE